MLSMNLTTYYTFSLSVYIGFIYLKTLFYNTLWYMSYTDEEQASEY